MHNKTIIALCTLVCLGLSGCAQQSAVSIAQAPTQLPQQFTAVDKISLDQAQNAWLTQVVDATLAINIEQALANNHALKQQSLSVQALQQTAIATGASLWPSASLAFSNSRRKQAASQTLSTSHDLSLSVNYEIDVWGKLSANQRQVQLQLASQQALLEQAKRDLVSQVILAWYSVAQAKQQLILSEKRNNSIKQNLAIIESGYESGINSALDVYLARNEAANEASRLATQKTNYEGAVRNLELLLGQYPKGALQLEQIKIPDLDQSVFATVPSQVVANNPSLNARWLQLLASDAGLAYAHKQRFPSISLTASTGVNSSDLSDLLSADLGWSLLGNITQPIFNAGRLKANEDKARFEVQQAEQSYLAEVKTAFANVENRLIAAVNLQTSYLAYQQAQQSAKLAEQLSFEQYLKGLVSYTTVLDAQNRAFNAESSLIQAQYQLLENRLQLHLAMGGDFSSITSNGNSNS